MYKNSPISLSNKWPPSPSREYITLAVVSNHEKCRDESIRNILHGDVQQILENRGSISIDQILESDNDNLKLSDNDNLKLVLLEGAPGIGKSTLAWELCRKWDEFSCMAKYKLVILLRLREKRVQDILNFSELFFSYEGKDKCSLEEEIFKCQGNGLLFILDGFDELPKTLQREGYLLNLIRGRVLPESTVLVTSRPSATAKLLTICCPQKRVEILGFTQESVEAYATSVFSSKPEMLKNFKTYISASNNPAINSLMMYIPLNAAIIVEIYRNCKSTTILPHTLTELYTQLCLTILNRFFDNDPSVGAFEDLPHDLYQQFLVLSKIAFEGMKNEEVIFQAQSPEVIHFGFLDAVSALYGGGSVSYNFLHLTLQEFFAAYHIAHLGCEGKELFQQYASNKRWNVVWQFVAGLTHFEHYKGLIESDKCFVKKSSITIISKQFIRCLFEAKNPTNFLETCSKKNTFSMEIPRIYLLDLDMYILGYCIANFFPSIGWYVEISGHYLHKNPLHYFVCGLKTKIPCAGFIEVLNISNWRNANLTELDLFFLHSVTIIYFTECDITSADLIHFSDLIPHLPSLKKLSFCGVHLRCNDLLMLFQQLSQSNVTDLSITGFLNEDMKLEVSSFPEKLEKLTIGGYKCNRLPGKLTCILSIPEHSSLKELCLYYTDISQLHLETNTTLIYLKIVNDIKFINYVEDVVKILNHNKTLQSMELMYFSIYDDYEAAKTIITALQSNDTIQKLVLQLICDRFVYTSPYEYVRSCHPAIPHDTRIVWRFY